MEGLFSPGLTIAALANGIGLGLHLLAKELMRQDRDIAALLTQATAGILLTYGCAWAATSLFR
jgi:hypothetical protein